MKKSKLLILFSAVIFAFSACSKDDDGGEDNQQTAEYYITYKADGATVTATEVSALRGTTESPRTLTIIGTAKEGASPKFKFSAKESLSDL